jgi:zinc protease
VTEPPRRQSRRASVTGPTVPLPALALLWQGPRAGHADAPAMQVASALLSQGESARLHEALVYREQVAQSAGLWADLNAEAGMLAVYAVAASGKPLPSIEIGLRRELARLAEGPIAPEELDKVRTQLVTGVVAARQTPGGLCDGVGWALVNHGDPRQADAELARLQAVTADDVQRVLRRYVIGRPEVVVNYTQRRGGQA